MYLVTAALEECINDDASTLSMLKPVWGGDGGSLVDRIMEERQSGDKDMVDDRILRELVYYWKGLAQQGRTLEEAAR